MAKGKEGLRSKLWPLVGIGFAFFWSSASTATKFGLQSVQPLTLAITRFMLASAIMLGVAHGLLRQPLPRGKQWRQLALYGILNISIYLGLYVVALQWVTAGIGAMAVAANPVIISFLSIFFLRHRFSWLIALALLLCTLGVIGAAWPLLQSETITARGLLILLACMLSYSSGAVFFAYQKWGNMGLFTINGWQTLLGGLFLAPFALGFYKSDLNHFNTRFWISVSWLAVMVSMLAVLLWLWLLKRDALRAGMWLYLCPVFGYLLAAVLLGDRLGWYTVAGIALVIAGLGLSRLRPTSMSRH